MNRGLIRVLIVEDSAIVADLLEGIFSSDPGLSVVGKARDGREGVELCRRLRPDVVTMDIRMPRMDGFEATETIMVECPTPILVVCADPEEESLDICFNAVRAGAMDVVAKPRNTFSRDYVALAKDLIARVRIVAGVRPIRRMRRFQEKIGAERVQATSPMPPDGRVVALAASTGGPAALSCLLSGLPADFSWPLLVVQHIAPGFLDGFARWLDGQTPLEVRIAEPGERPRAGRAYLAAEGCHLGVEAGGRLVLDPSAPVQGHRPSASYLFHGVAKVYGSRAVGVILTGMGRDGADGLLAMRRSGARTYGQDEATSLIYGMPRAAYGAGAVERELPLDSIAAELLDLATREEAEKTLQA